MGQTVQLFGLAPSALLLYNGLKFPRYVASVICERERKKPEVDQKMELIEVNEIEKSDLIVFNGPNGYGKTSAFDIIEFCLTGTIKRIGKYNEELAVKKTEAFDNKILISDETKEAFVAYLFDSLRKGITL